MGFRHAMEEAFQRGERIKDQLLQDVMGSQAVGELLQNELFLKSFTKVMNTRYELKKALKTNFNGVLKAFNVPSREEVRSLQRKLSRLEGEIGDLHRKVITTKVHKAKSSNVNSKPASRSANRKAKR